MQKFSANLWRKKTKKKERKCEKGPSRIKKLEYSPVPSLVKQSEMLASI